MAVEHVERPLIGAAGEMIRDRGDPVIDDEFSNRFEVRGSWTKAKAIGFQNPMEVAQRLEKPR